MNCIFYIIPLALRHKRDWDWKINTQFSLWKICLSIKDWNISLIKVTQNWYINSAILLNCIRKRSCAGSNPLNKKLFALANKSNRNVYGAAFLANYFYELFHFLKKFILHIRILWVQKTYFAKISLTPTSQGANSSDWYHACMKWKSISKFFFLFKKAFNRQQQREMPAIFAIIQPLIKNWKKTKVTLFPSTFKLWETKCP